MSPVLEGNPRLISTINVILVLMLAYSAAQLTWRLVPAPAPLPAPPAAKVVVASKSSTSDNRSLVRQLPNWHLFGQASVTKTRPKQSEIPETKLKLTLRGLFASDNPKEAWAIIADASGKENFYKVGGVLPGNAKLTEIHVDRIVLERRGKYETLRLPKKSVGLSATGTRNKRSYRNTTRSSASRGQERELSLREYRETLLNNPQKVTDLVSIAPVRKRGKFVGYSLQPGRDAQFLQRYGLKPGDIVTRVNGVPLDSPTKGFGVLRDLTSADRLDIEIERNGRRIPISLSLD